MRAYGHAKEADAHESQWSLHWENCDAIDWRGYRLVDDGGAAEPLTLRWSPQDIAFVDDGTVELMLTTTAGQPALLPLSAEQAAALRDDLPGNPTRAEVLEEAADTLVAACPDHGFVAMCIGHPMALAADQGAAKELALADAQRYYGPEFRWDEHRTGLRLMSREPGRRRWAWTQYTVVSVPQISGAR
ncbi:hypothetical protein ACWGNE_02145 [Streptomyces xiamenensis]